MAKRDATFIRVADNVAPKQKEWSGAEPDDAQPESWLLPSKETDKEGKTEWHERQPSEHPHESEAEECPSEEPQRGRSA